MWREWGRESLYVAGHSQEMVPRPLVLAAASDGSSRASGRFVSLLGVLNGRVS